MNRTDRFIASCPSWEIFDQQVQQLPDRGKIFERLVQLYLQNEPEYRLKLRNVWLLDELPTDIREAINLPRLDRGIDLIARDQDDKYWAVQAKYRRNQDQALGWGELSTFTGLSHDPRRNISWLVVAHTSTKPISNRDLMHNTTEIGLDRWKSADWSLILGSLKNKGQVRPKARKPRKDQARAIAAAKQHFKKAERGRMIMPCGTGKSLTAFWIADAIKARTIVVAVPSLGLIRQSVKDWTREFLAMGKMPSWLCVCSDDTVGNLEKDEFVGATYDTGLPTYTDPKEIAALLRKPSKIKIVFTTYQSGDRLATAAKLAGMEFDLIICDEAHRTVGIRSKSFATLLHDDTIKARHRLFMTATERRVNGETEVLSMDDDEADYGARFFTMTFKEAIDLGIICDYKILTIAVSDREVSELVARNRFLNLHQDLDEAEARAVATGIAVKKVYKEHGVKHAISFHASIRAADRFREQQDVLNCLEPKAENFHISSHKSAGERAELLDDFKKSPRALMTNARCLTEGIDVPAIDCVVFADPKQSATDVVQASGRAMRNAPGKTCGYIVVPIVVPEGMAFDEFAETTAFKTIVRIITALSMHDARIVDELRAIHDGRVPSGKIIKIDGKVPVGMHMSLERFAEAITTRMWQGVARVNWRPFEEARAFARSLALSYSEWRNFYSKSNKKPNDIPANPETVYSADWVGWHDWLGKGQWRGHWRPFEEARTFVRKLGLAGENKWSNYCKSGKKPDDIPANPRTTYANSGWISIADWLGTKPFRPIGGWRPFKEARAFVRSLGFANVKEWNTYRKSNKKPEDIPLNPHAAYANSGWINWGDWLGTGRQRGGWRPFKDARAFVRKLGLTHKEWGAYCRSGKKPNDIPFDPRAVYANIGWISMSDWLGSKPLRPVNGWRPFKEARAFAGKLGLESQDEWIAYCKSGKQPDDIPASPIKVYSADWVSWPDWLDNDQRRGGWRSFKEARAFARKLSISGKNEWAAYCKSGKKPNDIPADPVAVYRTDWVSWPDWRGSKPPRPVNGWRPFNEARTLVRKLGFRSDREWRAYCKSGKKPSDIPQGPDRSYQADWISWSDWLGTRPPRPVNGWRPSKEARAFVRSLGLANTSEWVAYSKSGKRPNDIPSNPQQIYRADWVDWADWLGK